MEEKRMWESSESFAEAVSRLSVSVREYTRPDIACSCPVPEGVMCYQCSWKKNVISAAREVANWEAAHA